jgi:hypothetical protein
LRDNEDSHQKKDQELQRKIGGLEAQRTEALAVAAAHAKALRAQAESEAESIQLSIAEQYATLERQLASDKQAGMERYQAVKEELEAKLARCKPDEASTALPPSSVDLPQASASGADQQPRTSTLAKAEEVAQPAQDVKGALRSVLAQLDEEARLAMALVMAAYRERVRLSALANDGDEFMDSAEPKLPGRVLEDGEETPAQRAKLAA